MPEKIKIAVLFGGRSGEHEVSLLSARSVMQSLDTEKYEVIPVGITREGGWVVGADPLAALETEDLTHAQAAAILADPTQPGLKQLERRTPEQAGQLALLSRVDVVFPVLHGTFGEDGTVQGLLELANVPYVGAGVLASALAMDKIAFKDVCLARGLPVTDFIGITRRRWEADQDNIIAEIETRLPYPVFTKPANLGSSVGISKCRDRAGLRAGLAEAAHYDRRILVEIAVPDAREIEVSVLGNENPSASIPGEIIPSREFYDYGAKYLDEGENASRLLIPAPLDAETLRQVQTLAVAAFQAIDGAGMARVDFLLSGLDGTLYLNEINTIPGFTKISMFAKLWEASGVPYRQLLNWLVDLALERHRENALSERIYRPPEM